MPFKFDIPTYGIGALPPNKRLPKFIVFIQACLSALTRKWTIFQDYVYGSNYDAWHSSYTYIKGARVWFNYAVYESLQDGNTNNSPQTSPLYWEPVNQYFTGATERASYTGAYLNLTYQLNTYFKNALTANGYFGFRQPPYPSPYDYGLGSGTFSDIYITNVVPAYASFLSFATEPLCTPSYTISSGQYDSFTSEVYSSATTYTFIVNIPLAVYNYLGANNTVRSAIVSKFINKFIASGTGYIIQTY